MRAPIRFLAVLALTMLSLPLAGTTPVYAHATLVSSTPAQDAVLEDLPDEVSFVFSEAMDPVAYVVVTSPDGTGLALGDPVVDGDTIAQTIEGAGDGTYVMAVKAVSRDGHPLTGRVNFVVGEPSELTTTEESTSRPAIEEGAAPASSTAGTLAAAGGRTWRGHDPWVWLVGPAFAGCALALWVAARRNPT